MASVLFYISPPPQCPTLQQVNISTSLFGSMHEALEIWLYVSSISERARCIYEVTKMRRALGGIRKRRRLSFVSKAAVSGSFFLLFDLWKNIDSLILHVYLHFLVLNVSSQNWKQNSSRSLRTVFPNYFPRNITYFVAKNLLVSHGILQNFTKFQNYVGIYSLPTLYCAGVSDFSEINRENCFAQRKKDFF